MRYLFPLLIILVSAFRIPVYAQESLPNPGKSAAVIVKIAGSRNVIKSLDIVKVNVYEGRAKNLHATIPPRAVDVLKIKVFDAGESLVFEGFFENPLYENLESFEEDGTVNRNFIPASSGFINVRFPLTESSGSFVLQCFTFMDDKENFVSSVNFKVQ